MMKRCSKCGSVEAEWTFGEIRLCQECWEEYASTTWWNAITGEPMIELEAFIHV